MFGLKLKKMVSNFHPVEVAGCGSETQLQVGGTLPVELRIHFKVVLYIFKEWRGQALQYLGQLCCYKQRPSHLRQPGDLSLQVYL